MQSQVKSILLIGMNRSGTKWLSNIFCNHSDVIGIQHQRHFGIVETNMFGVMQAKFGELSALDDYIGFIELWSKTDFFKISGVDKELFYKLDPRPTSYCELFDILMSKVASNLNKPFWLQKTSPLNVYVLEKKFLRYFGDSFFILIQRNMIDTLKSNTQLSQQRQQSIFRIVQRVFSYTLQKKIMIYISRNYDVALVSYEDLLISPEKVIKGICEKIGIEYQPNMLEVFYNKNTSFSTKADRKSVFYKYQMFVIYLVYFIFQLFPLKLLSKMYEFSKRKKLVFPFVFGTFSEIKEKHNLL
jgi:hypothetical protein